MAFCVKIFIFCLFFCQIFSKDLNYVSKQCKQCPQLSPKHHCYPWLTNFTCTALMEGEFVRFDTECNCCPECHLKRELHESCGFHSLPGFRVTCSQGLYCSKKYGMVCLLLNQKESKEVFKRKEKKRKKDFSGKQKKFETKSLLMTPDSQRPLKRVYRVKRTPFKFLIGLGNSLQRLGGRPLNTSGQPYAVAPPVVELNKKFNTINGGNANSINNNLGPTYIINNNYHMTGGHRGSPFAQRIRTDTNGSLTLEHSGSHDNSSQSTDVKHIEGSAVSVLTTDIAIAGPPPPPPPVVPSLTPSSPAVTLTIGPPLAVVNTPPAVVYIPPPAVVTPVAPPSPPQAQVAPPSVAVAPPPTQVATQQTPNAIEICKSSECLSKRFQQISATNPISLEEIGLNLK